MFEAGAGRSRFGRLTRSAGREARRFPLHLVSVQASVAHKERSRMERDKRTGFVRIATSGVNYAATANAVLRFGLRANFVAFTLLSFAIASPASALSSTMSTLSFCL